MYKDEAWVPMAKKHPEPINIITALANLSGSDITIGCRWLLPIIGYLPQFHAKNAKQLLDFSEHLDTKPNSFLPPPNRRQNLLKPLPVIVVEPLKSITRQQTYLLNGELWVRSQSS